MPVQMIELEEATMVETSDESLEATVAEVRPKGIYGTVSYDTISWCNA